MACMVLTRRMIRPAYVASRSAGKREPNRFFTDARNDSDSFPPGTWSPGPGISRPFSATACRRRASCTSWGVLRASCCPGTCP